MSLTYGQVKNLISRWAGAGGQCPNGESVDLFVKQVLQNLLYQGQSGNLRKYTFCAVKGCFTAPYELEVPLKVKIDRAVGSVWSKWFEWYHTDQLPDGCDVGKALFEEPNLVPTSYPLPAGGAYVGVRGNCLEAPDAHVIIKGTDVSGREVFTNHKGQKITGEYLTIEKGVLKTTTVKFGEIKEVYKTKTNGYATLYAYLPESSSQLFLSDYSPVEETPQYRRFKLTDPYCGPIVTVSVLGRIRLKPAYADNDLIPFENIYAISLAAEKINASFNNDTQSMTAKHQMLKEVIENENSYKRVQNGQPFEVFRGTSPGIIRSVVPRWGSFSRRWR